MAATGWKQAVSSYSNVVDREQGDHIFKYGLNLNEAFKISKHYNDTGYCKCFPAVMIYYRNGRMYFCSAEHV